VDFMPSPNRNTGRPTGRPYIVEYDSLSKSCETCGVVFGLRDERFQSRARFERRRFCSVACAGVEPSLREKFWGRIFRNDESGCWEWRGASYGKGYGAISIRGAKTRVHRFSYELHKGPIPEGLMILHACDNRLCVNPAHLRPGTAKENTADAIARGRLKGRSGT
jgi:hypothetical protein